MGIGLFLCGFSFVVCQLLTTRSLVAGILAVMTVGYLYGILRANYPDTFSHFIFDSAVLGCYISLLSRPPDPAIMNKGLLMKGWVWWLVGWALIMFFVPFQQMLIQLVGLRGNAFLVPFLLIGAWLSIKEANTIALGFAFLNLVAFAFALGEYFIGVPAFFPENAVTILIYRSKDVAGYSAHRIPACFSSAHAYAGSMVLSMPWLVGAWNQPGIRFSRQVILIAGLAVAMGGVFLSAARVHTVALFLLTAATLLSGRLRGGSWVGMVVIVCGVGYAVSSNERLQRFTTLTDLETVANRIDGSVNMTFLEMVPEYPLGNGLGAGGTSIPHFLQTQIQNPVVMENEYSRMLLELGLPGLMLWVGFFFWALSRPLIEENDPWLFGRKLIWYTGLVSCGTSLLGIGMLTSIPSTAMLFLGIGFMVTGTRSNRI